MGQKFIPFNQISVDLVKDFWNVHTKNHLFETKYEKKRSYFDMEEFQRYNFWPHIRNFVDFTRWKGKKVLEIGCGIGTDLINFARIGAQVMAMEISETALEVARERAKILNHENKIRFYLGNAEQLTHFLPPEKYDLVYSFGVIHHSPHPERIIEQIRHYVVPGSMVKITLYNRYSWKTLWIMLNFAKGKLQHWPVIVARHSEAYHGCPITHTYTRSQARELLEKAGFRVTDLKVAAIFPYNKYYFQKKWYFRHLPPATLKWLEKKFGWQLLLTAEAVNV
jgi:2-polyprenyl-3-methyl-5-hydroxy-6-metoxy-1,4-benzoquinol methylase